MADNEVGIGIEVTGDAKIKLAEISAEAKNLGTSGAAAFNQFGSTFQIAAGIVSGSLLVGAFKLVWKALSEFVDLMFVDGVKAAIAEEEALNRLNVAMASAGKYSKETSDSFSNYAEELERSTRYEKDAILTAGAYIESLGRLDKDGLKKATQATLDLAAATGKDLNEASVIVAKAAAGQTTAFNKLGIVVEKGTTNAQTFANALDAVNARFGGAAASAVNTYQGAVSMAGKAFDDVGKNLGQTVTQNIAVIDSFKEVSRQLFVLADTIGANQGAIKLFISQALIVLIETLKVAVQTTDVFVTGFQNVYTMVKTVLFGVAAAVSGLISVVTEGVSVAINAIVGWVPFVSDALKSFGDSQKAVFEDFKKSALDAAASTVTNFIGNGVLGQMATGLDGVGDAATKAYSKILSGTADIIPPFKNNTTIVNEQSDAFKKLQDAAEKAAEAIIKKGESGTEVLLAEQEQTQANYDAKLLTEQTYTEASKSLNDQLFQAKFDANVKDVETRNAMNANLTAIDAGKNAAEIAANQVKIDQINAANLKAVESKRAANTQEIADIKAKNAALMADDIYDNTDEIARNNAKIQKIGAADASLAKYETDLEKYKTDAEKRELATRKAQTDLFLSSIAGASKSNSYAMRYAAKGAAIAQAIINTYQGATGAFASLSMIPFVGWALGAAAAAGIIAAGFANVNAIRSTPLATGITSVPGIGTKDQFPAMLAPGERVVPRESNEDLKAFLKDSGGMAGIMASIDSKISKLSNQIVVQIGDREIMNVLRNSLNSGRSFAT